MRVIAVDRLSCFSAVVNVSSVARRVLPTIAHTISRLFWARGRPSVELLWMRPAPKARRQTAPVLRSPRFAPQGRRGLSAPAASFPPPAGRPEESSGPRSAQGARNQRALAPVRPPFHKARAERPRRGDSARIAAPSRHGAGADRGRRDDRKLVRCAAEEADVRSLVPCCVGQG